MSAFQPVTAPFGLANTEDLMELYPDQGSRPTADDSIDIDLDLTTDPLENVDDDEMIEDPELSLDSTEYQDIEAEYDEQMVDEGEEHNVLQDATEDVYQEHDEDLDDVDDDELGNGLDVEAGVIDQPLELDQGRSSITPQDATQQAAQTEGHIGFLIQSDMEPDAHGAPEESQELVGQDQVHEPPVVQNSLLSSTDAQSPPQTAPKGNTYVSGDRIEEPTQTNQSSSDGHASGSQRLQGTVGPSQIIDPEDQLQPDPSETFTTGPLEVVSGSIEKIGSVAAEAHSTGVPYAGATVINNASPKRSTTEPSFIHEDVSTSSGIGQTDSKSPSTGVSHQHQRDAGAAVVPQADLEQEVEASQEASYLHAVVVSYQENEMFLFPPAAEDQDDNQTYCLTNETLAADPIQDLLKECRHVLEGSLNDQEELEIEIEDLGLKIGESTSDSATTSLTDILDIYLQLHYHDGNETPPPMKMCLSTNLRFSHRLEYLTNFVNEGRGISQLQQEDSSFYSESPDKLQEITKAAAEPAADFNVNYAYEDPTDGIHGQHELSAEDATDQEAVEGFLHAKDPLSTGREQLQLNELATTTIDAQGADAPLADAVQLGNGEATSTTNSFSIARFPALRETGGFPEEHVDEGAEGQDGEHEEHASYGQVDDNNEPSSGGSSTIQGDELVTVNEDAGNSKEGTSYDSDLVSAEQHFNDTTGDAAQDEDQITYETDEEDGNENVGNSALQNTDDVEPSAALSPQYDDTIADASRGQNVKARAVDDHAATPEARNEEQLESTTEGQAGRPEVYDHHDQADVSEHPRPSDTHQEQGISGSEPKSSSLDPTNVRKAQGGGPSTEDEDEINFDEEFEDDAEIDDSTEAPTGNANEQAPSSSPGALKRPRATDDGVSPPAADTKRIRSR